MKILFTFACLALLVASCGNTKLKVEQISSVHLEYSPATDLNFGSSFEGRILAMMHNGDELDITTHRKLDFISADVSKSGKKFTIVKLPSNFDDNAVAVAFSVSDKDETFQAQDSIIMNFRGGLSIYGTGSWGADGEDQKDRGSRILLRDGKPGDDGTNGQPGSSGGSYEAHIWKEGEMYYVYVRDLNSINAWKYKTLATSTVLFDLSGGTGGRGGKGGGGGDGKDGSKDDDGKVKRPGDGGPGGHGGHGGNGGNGGSVHVVLHTNASGISPQLKYNLSGGSGGEGGKGGQGGQPGDALEGQANGSSGSNGRPGSAGSWGASGNSTVEFKAFDFEQFKQ